MKHKTIIYLVILNGLMLIYSFAAVISKTAMNQRGFPFWLIASYFCVLFLYAIGWQQILKRVDLSVAYANKSVALIWGLLWGLLFFKENINVKSVIGALVIIVGIIIISIKDKEKEP